MTLKSAQICTRCGRTRALASRLSRGTKVTSVAAIPAASSTPTTIQIAVWWLSEPPGTWKLPAAKPMAARNSSPFITQLAVDSIAPELSAAAGS